MPQALIRVASNSSISVSVCPSPPTPSAGSFAAAAPPAQQVVRVQSFTALPGVAAAPRAATLVRIGAYNANPADHLDELVAQALSSFDPADISELQICRVSPGKYTVRGEPVTVRLGKSTTGICSGGISDLMVDEGKRTPSIAFLTYVYLCLDAVASKPLGAQSGS